MCLLEDNLILPKSSLKLISSIFSIFFIDNISAIFSGRVLSTDSREAYGCQLCSSSGLRVSLFVEDRFNKGAAQGNMIWLTATEYLF